MMVSVRAEAFAKSGCIGHRIGIEQEQTEKTEIRKFLSPFTMRDADKINVFAVKQITVIVGMALWACTPFTYIV